MQPQSSPTQSDAYKAAKARFDSMTAEERSRAHADYEQMRDKRLREAARGNFERNRSGRIKASGIPADYRDGAVRVPEVRRWVDSVLAGGSSQLVIRGTNGTGKTTEACAALMELSQTMTVRFATLDSIKRSVDGVWISRRASPEEVLDGYKRCGCLLVDDLGQSSMGEKSTAMLLEIMSERIGNNKPTIYTTNYEGTALWRRLSEGCQSHANAILDRLKMCVPVVMSGESLRKRVRL